MTELEQAKNRIYELESGYIFDPSKSDIRISGTLNKIKADAISKAIDYLENDQVANYCIVLRDVREAIETLKEYADKVREVKYVNLRRINRGLY